MFGGFVFVDVLCIPSLVVLADCLDSRDVAGFGPVCWLIGRLLNSCSMKLSE